MRQALDDLGIDERVAADIGLRLYKVAMPWPLEAEGVRRFAEGLEEILVVEEKRQIIEYQIKEQLYAWREDVRPRVVGKFADSDEWMPGYAASPRAVAATTDPAPPRMVGPHGHGCCRPPRTHARDRRARTGARIARFHDSVAMRERLAFLERKTRRRAAAAAVPHPWFCSGCPHNRSTQVPGSCAVAGVAATDGGLMGRNTRRSRRW